MSAAKPCARSRRRSSESADTRARDRGDQRTCPRDDVVHRDDEAAHARADLRRRNAREEFARWKCAWPRGSGVPQAVLDLLLRERVRQPLGVARDSVRARIADARTRRLERAGCGGWISRPSWLTAHAARPRMARRRSFRDPACTRRSRASRRRDPDAVVLVEVLLERLVAARGAKHEVCQVKSGEGFGASVVCFSTMT